MDTVLTILQNTSQKVTSRCNRHLRNILTNFSTTQESWAFQMLDASSEVLSNPSHLKYGEVGNFKQCIKVGKYCLGTINLNSTQDAPTAALCVPYSCTIEDVNIIGNAMFEKSGLKVWFPDYMCQTADDVSAVLTPGAIVTIAFLSLLVSAIAGFTIYDYYIDSSNKNWLVKGFSVYSNAKEIFNINTKSDKLACLNGLRCISMVWVVVLHHKFTTGAANPAELKVWISTLRSKFVTRGILAVDTFLIISGFLISYNFMKRRLEKKSFSLLTYYIHRYVRLTSALSVLVLVTVTLSPYVGSGPKWPIFVRTFQNNCEKNWWSTFLHVQNYVHINDWCHLHTWYIDADMQLYLLSPLILFPLRKYPKFGLPVLLSGWVLFTAVPFYVAWVSTTNLNIDDSATKYYFFTHTKCTPWLFGTILGYFFIKTKQRRWHLNKFLIATLLGTSLATLMACVLVGNYNPDCTKWENATRVVLVQLGWSFSMMWVIFVCIHGLGGAINKILSFPVYQVFNRFTFCIYLTHFIVIAAVHYGRQRSYYFSEFDMAYDFWGTFMFSTGFAILLVFMVECPVFAIEKKLLGTWRMEPHCKFGSKKI